MNESQSYPHDEQCEDNIVQDQMESAADQGQESVDPAESRDDEMAQLRPDVVAADKRVLQAQADAENFRKRMRRDYEDQLKFAAMPLISDILEVRDNLDRAVEAAAANSGDAPSSGLRDGVAMVVKQLDETLAKYGVEPIPAEGEVFDPNNHQAISQMPHPEIDSGKVAHVATSGFRMHGRVVRPAQVVVSSGTP